MSKPVVVRLADGSEWGVADAKTAQRRHPTATIVRHEDGTAFEDPRVGEPQPRPKERSRRTAKRVTASDAERSERADAGAEGGVA